MWKQGNKLDESLMKMKIKEWGDGSAITSTLQRTSVPFPAPMLGSSQPPLTLAPSASMSSSGLLGYSHGYEHTRVNTITCMDTLVFHSFSAIQLAGCLGAWVSGCLSVWVSGCLGIWVARWLCRWVAGWLGG